MRVLRSHWVIFSIIFLGFLVRLYRIDNPIADWHSWRQADTSAVSRNFIKHGYDIFHPQYDDISNIQSGFDNPHGYRFVEFPIYNLFQACITQFVGVLTLEEWGRIVSILSSLFSILFIYSLVKRHGSFLQANLSAFFFAFLPYSIYYSRTILPDEMMVMAILGGTYFFDLAIEKKFNLRQYGYFLLALVFTSSAFLLKPYALFFTLPMIYLAYKTFGLKMIVKWQLWAFGILSVIPLIWWRVWVTHFPEGVPVNTWLFNGGDVRFKLYWIRWILFERMTKLIFGFGGLVLFLLGFLKERKEKDYFFPFTFLVSSILYIIIIARGNLQHDYYQILIIPSLSIILSRGVIWILGYEKIKKEFAIGIVALLIIGSFVYSSNQVKDYFNINNRAMIAAGKKADEILPKKAKVIAPLDGDTSFLYQVNRKGWPAFEKGPDELKQLGATHMILLNPTQQDFDGFGKRYSIVAKDKEYLILKL